MQDGDTVQAHPSTQGDPSPSRNNGLQESFRPNEEPCTSTQADNDTIHEVKVKSCWKAPVPTYQSLFDAEHEEEHPDQLENSSPKKTYFYYELPLAEETGAWMPVSVPQTEANGFENSLYESGNTAGGYFPADQSSEDVSRARTSANMWETLYNVLDFLFEKGKTLADCVDLSPPTVASGDKVLQEAEVAKWRLALMEFSPKIVSDVDGNVHAVKAILEAEPPLWMPDSSASACMLCGTSFRPLTCGRHHCRFCGGIFCSGCSTGRCLLPLKFRERNPQRVCDTCWLKLEPTQRILAHQVSNAAQPATHDVTDFSCSRAWLNSPWGTTMEQEIFKAANTLRCFSRLVKSKPEESIPDAVLSGAKGLAILTCFKAGLGVTYKIGTGLVVGQRLDGTWSAPSAIASCGIGWGFQVGGELTDYIIVLRTEEAVKAFGGRLHFSVGAELSAAAGPIGRAAEADVRAGDGGAAACYTYSCSKGAFIGCSLEGNVVTTRDYANQQFYGDSSITTNEILLGSMSRPKAATPLYDALRELFEQQS